LYSTSDFNDGSEFHLIIYCAVKTHNKIKIRVDGFRTIACCAVGAAMQSMHTHHHAYYFVAFATSKDEASRHKQ